MKMAQKTSGKTVWEKPRILDVRTIGPGLGTCNQGKTVYAAGCYNGATALGFGNKCGNGGLAASSCTSGTTPH